MPSMPPGFAYYSAHIDEIPTATFHDIAALRQRVFVVEQNCVYLDLDGRDLDPEARQLWVEDAAGEVVATVRILPERDGAAELGTDGVESPSGVSRGSAVSIGRVVTAPEHRGRGIAGALLEAAIAACAGKEVELHAQSHLTDWYGSYGFVPDGDEYLEDGIPHTPMRLARP